MIWPFKPRPSKQIARIEITGAIASETRQYVLQALETIKEKKFPALLLRIDSPGGTVGDSQEIYEALKRLQDQVKIVASFWQYFCLWRGFILVWGRNISWLTLEPLPEVLESFYEAII